MKRLLLLVAVFVGTMSVSAQRNIQVWEGNTYSEFSTGVVDSVTFLLSPEGVLRECKTGTVFITKTDTVEKVVTKHDTVTVVKYDTIYIENKSDSIGVFSVSADRQVSFAPGNLQYQASTNTWRFAEQQYDYVGDANNNISATYTGWIDLFGWSANNFTAPWGVSTSIKNADYAGDFVDWGTNTIGNDAPNTWRTLTYDEWEYLFQHTPWTMAKVNGTLGFMLLPTDFTAPSGMPVAVLGGDGNMSETYVSFNESDYAFCQYTVDEFAQFEMRGCVFLPCAGSRVGSGVGYVGSSTAMGTYWSATWDCCAKYLRFSCASAELDKDPRSYCNDFFGRSVRLVRDIE